MHPPPVLIRKTADFGLVFWYTRSGDEDPELIDQQTIRGPFFQSGERGWNPTMHPGFHREIWRI
jgi:hypothetical protein